MDECTFGINEGVARYYAPRGRGLRIDRLSSVTERGYSISGITPQGELFFGVQEQAYTSQDVITFLEGVRVRLAPGEALHVVWDNASIHRSRRLRHYLKQCRRNHYRDPTGQSQLFAYNTPAYCPWYNPDEQVWNYVKAQALKYRVATSRAQMRDLVYEALAKLQRQPKRIRRFFHHPRVKLLGDPVSVAAA